MGTVSHRCNLVHDVFLKEVDFAHSKRRMPHRPPNLISLLILKLPMMVLLHSKLLQVHRWEPCLVLSLLLLELLHCYNRIPETTKTLAEPIKMFCVNEIVS